MDFFFCEKCLELKEVKKEAHVSDGMEHTLPDWAETISNKRF